jgi:hypothetical protein
VNFQMSVASLRHSEMLRSIELLGSDVIPMVRKSLPRAEIVF